MSDGADKKSDPTVQQAIEQFEALKCQELHFIEDFETSPNDEAEAIANCRFAISCFDLAIASLLGRSPVSEATAPHEQKEESAPSSSSGQEPTR